MSKVPLKVADALQTHCVERSVRVGGSIEVQGERSDVLRVIKVGMFKCERVNATGERAAVCLVGRGRVVGYANLFKQSPIMTMTAMLPSRVCEIPIAVIYDRAFIDRAFRQYMYRCVGEGIENVADWACLVRESNISKRLLAAFELMTQEEGSRVFRIPGHAELGALVVARRESVARHIGMLLREGKLLKLDRWRAIFKPTPEELKAAARFHVRPLELVEGDE
ncbi:Crp/Fnr family transcriptional regulator [Hydrogenophaga sp.]|uniref:Crp/Fnr family transcriptional regulator n=1 Tax=Hydrogenophaga sp. TaxID=1904254 RepID=UPI0035B3F7DE